MLRSIRLPLLLLSACFILAVRTSSSQNLTSRRQGSFFTFIYKISDEQARRIYTHGVQIDSSFLTTFVDLYPTDSAYSKKLPVGHYLEISAKGQDLHAEIRSINNLNMNILNNHRDLVLVFSDSLGNEVSTARVEVKRKKIQFDSNTKSYRLANSNRKGLVSVVFQGHTSYFDLSRMYNKNLIVRIGQRFSSVLPVRILISPLTYVLRNVKAAIAGDQIFAPGIYYRTKRLLSRRHYKGFLVFNKPVFKPGDTLRLKAFLTTSNGRPRSKEVFIRMNKGYRDSKMLLGRVESYHKGAYKFDIKLPDSLQLDQFYRIDITDRKGHTLISEGFRYEEYELKANQYSARSENNAGGYPALYLKANDSNDMPLFDVRAEILITPNSISGFYSDHCFVKDSLWYYTTKLENIGETKVSLPDSIFEDVAMQYTAAVTFLNSANERVTKEIALSFNKQELPVTMELKDDSLMVRSYPSKNGIQQLNLTIHEGSNYRSSAIKLPHHEKVSYYASDYCVSEHGRSKTLTLNDEPDQIQILAGRTKDSVTISSYNPRQIPFRYFLFRNSQLLESGHGEKLSLKRKAKIGDSYSLSVQFIWAGKSETREFQFPFDDKQLDIKINHPAVVYPGQKVEFTVSVQDAFGDPVGNVDLTAYSVTKKFSSYASVNVPRLAKRQHVRMVFNEFESNAFEPEVWGSLDRSYWRKTLGLDSISFYKFLFPVSGYYELRAVSPVAQFAPFVVASGRFEAVHVIYDNGTPVYYNNVGTIQPYSFALSPGVHTIKLRTQTKLITINHVKIDSAQKLMFSIDRNHLPKNCLLVEMPDKFTDEEINTLSRYFIHIERNSQYSNSYLQQGGRIHIFSPMNNGYFSYDRGRNYYADFRLAGPFYPGRIGYIQQNGFNMDFDYEPNFKYQFEQHVVKMRELDSRQLLKNTRLGWWTYSPSFVDSVLTKQTVDALWTNSIKYTFRRFPEFDPDTPGTGKLTLQYEGQTKSQSMVNVIFIVNLDDPDEYYVLPRQIKAQLFKKGRYQAIVILNDNRYLKADSIVVKPFGTNYYDLSRRAVHMPDSFSVEVLRMVYGWSKSKTFVAPARRKEMQKLRSAYFDASTIDYGFTNVISGKVIDENGKGIPGVNIVIKGTTEGTVSDGNGFYRLKCPDKGQLVFSFIGMKTESKEIHGTGIVDATLQADVAQLSEVVVTGLNIPLETKTIPYSADAVFGRVAGVAIHGGRSVSAEKLSIRIRGAVGSKDKGPLIILDGEIVDASHIDYNKVAATEFLDAKLAAALYGQRGAEGVILLSTKRGTNMSDLRAMGDGVLNSVAMEDLPGNSLRKNFRDYAFWKPDLTTNTDGKAFFDAVFPDDIGGWNAYVLGMGTKRRTGQTMFTLKSHKPLTAQVAQPYFMVEGDTSIISGKITNYGRDSIRLTQTIKINQKATQERAIKIFNSRIDTIMLTTDQRDTVTIEYAVKRNDYRDGELRKIPVLKRGTLEAIGQFMILNGDTTLTLSFEKGPVKLYAQADLMDVLTDETDYLKYYTYECNEQLASKLKGLLVSKQINEIRKEKFSGEREIRKIIKKLATAQNPDGSWGWWKGGRGETWITLHVGDALLKAEKAGFGIFMDKNLMITYLENHLTSAGVTAKLEVLNFLSDQHQRLVIKDVIDSTRISKTATLRDKLLAIRLDQNMTNPVDWKWINSIRSTTIKGNYYWGDDRMNLTDNAIMNTLLVYKIALKAGLPDVYLNKIENYFLEQRKQHWRNTYESSLILEALLPEMIKRKDYKTSPSLDLSGAVVRHITSFPTELSFPAGNLTVTKTGSAPIYFTSYREEWNSKSAATEKKDFGIRTSFDNDPQKLTAGKPVRMKIEVDVKGDAEYIMIEVPIPAGCTYQSKPQSASNGEVHREYFNYKTNIYCQNLSKGKHIYTIDLLPRYSGTYTLNPAVMESMYFPTLFGREAMKVVTVKP